MTCKARQQLIGAALKGGIGSIGTLTPNSIAFRTWPQDRKGPDLARYVLVHP